jgi:hypothetical protein
MSAQHFKPAERAPDEVERGQEHRPRADAGREARQQHQTHVMEERDPSDARRVLVDAEGCRDLLDVGRHGSVGDHRAGRCSRGTGRVLQIRRRSEVDLR